MRTTHARARLAHALPEWALYAAALAIVGAALWLRWGLAPYLVATSYLPFFPAILLAARLLGRGPAILSAVLSGVVATYYFVPPYGALDLAELPHVVPFLLFIGVSLFMIEMIERLHTTNLQLSAEVATAEQSRAEAAAASAQRALLLDEINHRIKNHLASVAGLAGMAARRSGSREEAEGALTALEARLQVLARVYDRLHLTGAGTVLEAQPLLEAMCADLRTSLIGSRPVTVLAAAENLPLTANEAALVGLIVNELVQNALKHAFPDERAGTVEVRLSRADLQACLEVADDGIGLPEASRSAGSGSRLVESLARQLGGTVEVHNGVGTRFRICFPLKVPA